MATASSNDCVAVTRPSPRPLIWVRAFRYNSCARGSAVPWLHERRLPIAPERDLQLVGNCLGDFILDFEDAGQLAVVFLRPAVIAALRIDQLRGDAHVVAGTLHAAFEHAGNAECLTDLAQVLRLALERESRSAGCDLEPRNLGQRVEDFVGDAVAEVIGLRITAHVDEWQY